MADKPDITELLEHELRLAIMTDCTNAEHNYAGQQCDRCDPICEALTKYARERAKELRERR